MLVGGALGVFLRNILEGPRLPDSPRSIRWRTVAIGTVGGFVLGALTGAALMVADGAGPGAALGIALSAALLTYCLFSSAATGLIKQGFSRHTLIPAALNAVTAFVAATAGVTLGVILAS